VTEHIVEYRRLIYTIVIFVCLTLLVRDWILQNPDEAKGAALTIVMIPVGIFVMYLIATGRFDLMDPSGTINWKGVPRPKRRQKNNGGRSGGFDAPVLSFRVLDRDGNLHECQVIGNTKPTGVLRNGDEIAINGRRLLNGAIRVWRMRNSRTNVNIRVSRPPGIVLHRAYQGFTALMCLMALGTLG